MSGVNFALTWDGVGKKVYEMGCDRGVLYKLGADGTYNNGEAWDGLTGIDENPSGADANKQFANNNIYANLRGTEEYGGAIKAYTYPDGWNECDGHPEVVAGVSVGQQNRKGFGLSYRTLKGNDTEGLDYGYEIKLVYGATCSPTSQSHATTTDSPDLEELSWDFDTVPVDVVSPTGERLKKTSTLVIDSTKVNAAKLTAFEQILYGTPADGNTAAIPARLPLPTEVLQHFYGTQTP